MSSSPSQSKGGTGSKSRMLAGPDICEFLEISTARFKAMRRVI